MEVLSVENLTFKYPDCESNALSDVSFGVYSGDFILVCGKSGSGKSTLLKLLKKELAPFGDKKGKVLFFGNDIDSLDDMGTALEIGFVAQNPESQIVTDKVYKELAFGLENAAEPNQGILRKTAEMASYFGIEDVFRSDTATLSGGQKQMVNLASVMAADPKVLVLDEPTSQLDPIAADEFISTLKKLNSELGLTVIISEHRTEKLFAVADKVLLLNSGKVQCFDSPQKIIQTVVNSPDREETEKLMLSMPSSVRIFYGLSNYVKETDCPKTVKEGRRFLSDNFTPDNGISACSNYVHSEDTAVELKDVWFRYEKNSKDIMRGVNLKIYSGEFFCILGGNGAGKSTALSVISALNKPYRGKVFIKNKDIKSYKSNSLYKGVISLLPQNPQSVFIKDTVYDDMKELLKANQIPKNMHENLIEKTASSLSVSSLLSKHPYDLSGGEQQKCAIAKLLLLKPQIILLDEPTKGLDAYSKKSLAQLLLKLKSDGITVIVVTHDVEFAAEYSDRCALYFDSQIISPDIPKIFFSQNKFYTTPASAMSRGIFENAVTCEDVISCAVRSIGNE